MWGPRRASPSSRLIHSRGACRRGRRPMSREQPSQEEDQMSGDTPTAADVRALAAGHSLVPVHRDLLADTLTPVRAHALLCPPGPPMPESAFLLAESLAAFDHVRQRLKLITMHRPDREPYAAAVGRLDEMQARLEGTTAVPAHKPDVDGATWRSNVSRGHFESMV